MGIENDNINCCIFMMNYYIHMVWQSTVLLLIVSRLNKNQRQRSITIAGDLCILVACLLLHGFDIENAFFTMVFHPTNMCFFSIVIFNQSQ